MVYLGFGYDGALSVAKTGMVSEDTAKVNAVIRDSNLFRVLSLKFIVFSISVYCCTRFI